MRAIDDSSVSTGGTLIESLRDQLRLSKERIEVVEKRLADVETRESGSHNKREGARSSLVARKTRFGSKNIRRKAGRQVQRLESCEKLETRCKVLKK